MHWDTYKLSFNTVLTSEGNAQHSSCNVTRNSAPEAKLFYMTVKEYRNKRNVFPMHSKCKRLSFVFHVGEWIGLCMPEMHIKCTDILNEISLAIEFKRAQDFLCLSRPAQGPPSLLYNGYQIFRGGKVARA